MSMTTTGDLRRVAGAGPAVRRCGPALALAALLLAGFPSTTVSPFAGPVAADPMPLARLDAAPFVQPRSGGRLAMLPAALPAPLIEPEAVLVGLDQSETRRLLGSPAATEEESPAKVWRYAQGGCTLKVFFFMNMTSQDFRALSYDMTSSHNVPDDDQRCFAHLVAQAWDGGDAR